MPVQNRGLAQRETRARAEGAALADPRKSMRIGIQGEGKKARERLAVGTALAGANGAVWRRTCARITYYHLVSNRILRYLVSILRTRLFERSERSNLFHVKHCSNECQLEFAAKGFG